MRLGLVLALTLLTGTVCAQEIPTPDPPKPPESLEGAYLVEGTNPDGSIYQGTLYLSVHDDVWALKWLMDPPQIGAGILTGDVLSVSIQSFQGGSGVAAYVVDRTDGIKLKGRWVADGAVLATENLTKTADTSEPPEIRLPRRPFRPTGQQVQR